MKSTSTRESAIAHNGSAKRLASRIRKRSAEIAVVGGGYVGLPLAVEFARAGFSTTVIDVDPAKIAFLRKRRSYVQDVSSADLSRLVRAGKLCASVGFPEDQRFDAVCICVPTPLNKVKDPDVSFIVQSINALSPHLREGMLIVLESTTYPGTTQELVLPRLEERGLTVGRDIFLCFSPERIDPGNRTFSLRNTPKVIGGVTENCTRLGVHLYSTIIEKVHPVSSPAAAEMVKLLENTFRSINIGLVNEVALMCEKLGLDVWEVIKAAGTKPFGFMPFTPGPGLGGHCIPIDPHYLAWKMKLLDFRARFIELAGEINTLMPSHVVDLISAGLNGQGRPVKGSRVLILGVAYKKDSTDTRESPSLDVMKLLEAGGAVVEFYDPWVSEMRWNGAMKKSLPRLTSSHLKRFHAVAVLTDHSAVDYFAVRRHSRLIIDTRNIFPRRNSEGVGHRSSAEIVRLGAGRPARES